MEEKAAVDLLKGGSAPGKAAIGREEEEAAAAAESKLSARKRRKDIRCVYCWRGKVMGLVLFYCA